MIEPEERSFDDFYMKGETLFKCFFFLLLPADLNESDFKSEFVRDEFEAPLFAGLHDIWMISDKYYTVLGPEVEASKLGAVDFIRAEFAIFD